MKEIKFNVGRNVGNPQLLSVQAAWDNPALVDIAEDRNSGARFGVRKANVKSGFYDEHPHLKPLLG